MKQLRGTDLKRLHRSWRRSSTFRLGLLLEGLQGPFNVGAIVRTAAAMNADDLYLVNVESGPTSPKTQKTALGTDRYLNCREFNTIEAAIAQAKSQGYTVVGLELCDDSVPLSSAPLATDVMLVLGHEDRGITAACLVLCDVVAFIPQLGKVGSLNVASAAAIGCYEVRRQGNSGPLPSADDFDDLDLDDA